MVLALPLCLLFPLLVDNFRIPAIDAPYGALNDAPEFTAIESIMFSSLDSLSWFVASIFKLFDCFIISAIQHKQCFRQQLHSTEKSAKSSEKHEVTN